MKTLKELETDIKEKWHYAHLEIQLETLKDVLKLIDELPKFCDCGLTNRPLKELKARITG